MSQGILPSHLDDAVAAAIALGRAGAGAEACAAAGRIVGGLGTNDDRLRLQREIAFVEGMLAELREIGRYPEVDPAALAAISRRLESRSEGLGKAAAFVFVPYAPAPQPVAAAMPPTQFAPAPAMAFAAAAPPAAPPRPPRPPLGPSLRQFASEHSILLLSYAGAFLLIVAVVLFELYGVASLGAPVRFGGVLGLDLVFAAAGWACLRSRRLNLVGHTYVAIAALQAPLVFVAGYVFFALQQKGIGVDLALLATGAACAILYGALALRLHSHAYGALALIAIPVAWFGGVDLVEIGAWRGPIFGTLVAVYSLIAYRSDRVGKIGDVFARFAVPFVHGVAGFAAGLTFYDTAFAGSWPAGIFTVLLSVVGAGYLLYRILGGTREGSILAQVLLLLAWTSFLHDTGAGSWRGALTALAGVPAVVVALRRPRVAGIGEKFAPDASWVYHAAAGLGLLLLAIDFDTAQGLISGRLAATLAAIAAVYLLAAIFGAGREAVAVALAAAGLAWAAGVHDLHLGDWAGAAVAALVCVYALAALPVLRRTRLGGLALPQLRYHSWGASAIALGLLAALASPDRITGWPAVATLAVLALGFAALAALSDDVLASHSARLAFGLGWTVAAKDLWHGQWAGPATAALAVLYALPAHRLLLATRLGRLAGVDAEPYLYLAALAALGLSAGYATTTGELVGWPTTTTFAVLTLAFGAHAVFSDGMVTAIVARLAFGAGWVLAVHDLGLGAWRGTADTLLVGLYALSGLPRLQVGRLGALLATRRQWLVHSSAAIALGLTTYDSFATSGSPWLFPATFAGLALAYLVFARLGGGAIGATLSLGTAGLAWLTAALALDLKDWSAVAMAPLAIAYLLIAARAAVLGSTGVHLARAARRYVHVATIFVLLLASLFEQAHAALPVGGRWITWQAPAVLAIVAATYLGHWAFFRRPLALFAMAVAASLAVLAAGQVLQQHSTGAAIELVLLAAGWAAGAVLATDRDLRALLRAGIGVLALLPLVVTAEPSTLAAVLLLAATAVLVAMARLDLTPGWLLAAVPTSAAAWFWAGAALLPNLPAGEETLARLFAPFVLGLGLVAISLRVSIGRRWALPLYLYAGLALVSVEALFLSVPDLGLAGRWLLADVVVIYAIAGIEERVEAAVVAALAALAGLGLILAAAGAAPIWYPVALGALSVALYAGQLPWERFRDRSSGWIGAHRYLGLGGAAMTALSGFALTDYTLPGTLGCALAGLAVLVFASLVAADGRRFAHPEWDYAAAFAASLATYFGARYFAAVNPEWYLVGPGLALLGIGLRMPFDPRLKLDPMIPQLAVGGGALLILGVTASQAVVDAGWTNTVLLVFEGAAALVAGIGFRNRVLVVAGGAALGVAALKSLFVLVQNGYLFVAFGAVALVLLGLGAGLALFRDRFQEARSSIAEQWGEWN
jgi:hypothetical protein